MQKRRILPALGKHPSERTVTHRRFAGNKCSKKDVSKSGRPANDFLKTVFRPLPAIRFNPLFNQTNYDCLYTSANNYAGLLGGHFDYSPAKKDFTGLFRYFENLLPEGQHLMLIEENKKLLFRVFFGDDFLTYEAFFIPIIVLNRTEGVVRDILLTFFQHFFRAHHFLRKEDLYDYEMIVDCCAEEWHEYDGDPERRNYIEAYKNGYINDTFSLIYQKPTCSIKNLETLVKSYTAKNELEKRLIESIRQGINILRMNKNIFGFVRRPEENDGNDYDAEEEGIIEAEKLIRFVYSSNDCVSNDYLEYINAEIRESACEYFPRNSLIISPQTDCLLEVDYVECFFTWLAEFIKNLYDYEYK